MDKPIRFLRRPDVLALTGLSATTIYLLEQKGEFPKHFLATPRCACWSADAVTAWMAARMARPEPPVVGPDQAMRKSRPGRGRKKHVDAAVV